MYQAIQEGLDQVFESAGAEFRMPGCSITPPIIAKMIKNAIDQNFILTIDLEKQTVTTSEDELFAFDFDPFRKTCFLKGQDDLDYLLEVTS